MPDDLPFVHLFTDGACSGNPGPGGWAFVLRHLASGKEMEKNGGEAETTNNRMELAAVIEGLSALTANFYQPTNLLNLARGVSWFAVAALGVSMVIVIGGIDLSVGAVMALAGLGCGLCLRAGLPLPVDAQGRRSLPASAGGIASV